MSYLNILTRIKTDVESVEDIGNVYEFKKHVHDEQSKHELFKSSSKLLTWFIYRDGSEPSNDYNTLITRNEHFIIEGYYSLKDRTETEKTFQALVNSVIDAVNNDRLLGGYGYVTTSAGATEIDEVMFVDVLCNHAVIEFDVLTTHTAGAKDMIYTGTETFLTSSARTTDGVSESFDVEKYIEGVFYINVTAASGTGERLTCIAQVSPDNSTFYDFEKRDETIVKTGTYIFPVRNFGKYLKFRYEIAGTSASFTFTVTFEGKNPYGV